MRKLEELLLAENEEEKEVLLKEIVRSDPTNVIACLKLGDILRDKGYYVDALKLHKSLLIESYRISGLIKKKIYVSVLKDYLQAGKPKFAIEVADDLCKLEKENIELLKFLSSVYEDFSQWEKAIEVKQRILKLTGESDNRGLAILYAFWGDSLVKEGNKTKGFRRFKEALRLDSLCLPALLFMGDFYYEDGNIDESVKVWKRILDNIPDFAFLAFDRLENAYYAKHEISELEALYTSFLSREPKCVSALISLAEIYEKKGQDREAIEILEKAKEIDSQNIMVRKKLLKLYYDTKQYNRVFEESEMITSIFNFKSFKCLKCNTQFDEFKFKCPNCKSWLTIR